MFKERGARIHACHVDIHVDGWRAKNTIRRDDSRRRTLKRAPQVVCALICAVFSGLAAQSTRSVWDGVYTTEQAARGAALYAEQCAGCHGTELTGGESAPPLAGGDFLSNWNGLTAGDLFDRIRTTMPANRPGRLSRDQNADILAFMFGKNGFPAGKTELERQSEPLKQIRVESSRPEK